VRGEHPVAGGHQIDQRLPGDEDQARSVHAATVLFRA
jgi:hypothetical protein